MIPAIPHTASAPRAAREPWRGRSRQHLQVLLALPIGDRSQVALPLVALVPVEHLVQPARHRAPDHLVTRQRIQGRAEALGHALDLRSLLEQVVGVALLGRARVELAADAVEPRPEQRRDRQIRVTGGVDAAVLEPTTCRYPYRRGAILPAPVLIYRRPEPGIPHAAV